MIAVGSCWLPLLPRESVGSPGVEPRNTVGNGKIIAVGFCGSTLFPTVSVGISAGSNRNTDGSRGFIHTGSRCSRGIYFRIIYTCDRVPCMQAGLISNETQWESPWDYCGMCSGKFSRGPTVYHGIPLSSRGDDWDYPRYTAGHRGLSSNLPRVLVGCTMVYRGFLNGFPYGFPWGFPAGTRE